MNVGMSLGIESVRLSLINSGSMPPKREGLKDTDGSTTGDAIEQVSMSLLIYEDTKLLVDKDVKLKWQDINDTFLGTFGQDPEDRRVYVNIHKSGLY